MKRQEKAVEDIRPKSIFAILLVFGWMMVMMMRIRMMIMMMMIKKIRMLILDACRGKYRCHACQDSPQSPEVNPMKIINT